jgi:hypothetical protein
MQLSSHFALEEVLSIQRAERLPLKHIANTCKFLSTTRFLAPDLRLSLLTRPEDALY